MVDVNRRLHSERLLGTPVPGRSECNGDFSTVDVGLIALAPANFRREPFCTVFPKEMSDPVGVSRRQSPAKPRRPALLRWFSGHSLDHNRAEETKTQMHPEDLMSADMPSEILLLVSGSLIFVMLLLILVAALTQTAALP